MSESPRTGRPRGTGGTHLRWVPPAGEGRATRRSGHLYVGRALWQQRGEPARLQVARQGARLVLRPCSAPLGYAVAAGGMPRLTIGAEAAARLRLAPGQWPAALRAGAIVAEVTP